MDNLINSHDLKNIVINYEESQVIKDILKYQNEILKCQITESENTVIISLPNYNHVIKNSSEITNIINSAGTVLILNKVEHLINKDLYEFKKELFTNNNSQFEHFGDIVELSLNEQFIFVTTKTNKVYIYTIEGILIQIIENLKECLNNIPYFNLDKCDKNISLVYYFDSKMNNFVLNKINVNNEDPSILDPNIICFSLLLSLSSNDVIEIEDIFC